MNSIPKKDNNLSSIQSTTIELQPKNTTVQVEGFEYPSIYKVEYFSPFRRTGRISDNLLETLYLRTSKLRECVDGIAREVSSHEITLIPLLEDVPKEFWKAIKIFSISFFSQVNRKYDNFRILIEKIVRDLLVFSRAFVEKVRDKNGNVVELYVRDPKYIIIQKDEHGVITSFTQNLQGKKVEFDPKDIIYFTFNPCSYDDYGLSIIEGILDEIATLILANRTIANHIFDDTVPPGVLVLGEIGEEAYERLKAMFTNPAERNKLKVIRNIDPSEVSWIKLDRSLSSDQKIDYLLDRLDEIIMKAFQIPLDKTMSSRGGAEMTDKIAKSKLITPLVKLLEDKFTYELFVSEFKLPVQLQFIKSTLNAQEFYDISRGTALLVNSGVINANEARQNLGLLPISSGVKRIGKLGNEFVVFDEEGTPHRLPEFANK